MIHHNSINTSNAAMMDHDINALYAKHSFQVLLTQSHFAHCLEHSASPSGFEVGGLTGWSAGA